MASVASLLNPIKSEPREPTGLHQIPPSPCTLYSTSSAYASPDITSQQVSKRQKMVKDGAVFTKGKIKGEIRFPPFENFDKETLKEIMKFNVYPIGRITAYPRHIPYNSEKKTFLEKTGRESFEVFQYNFQVPNDEKEYTVMWDYNIGLVRITPFFKCCKYSKTTPAKMLNLNPGLKEITHSITGGALAAQGYWMPWSCALAVCTTFCHHISPALIPIFGPNFPSQCVPHEAPEHGRMTIRPAITEAATLEAERFRIIYSSDQAPQVPMFIPRSQRSQHSSPSMSPHQRPQPDVRKTLSLGRRLRLKRAFDGDSPYGTDTGSETASDTGSDRYIESPITPSSATSASPSAWKKCPPPIPRTEPLPAIAPRMSPSTWTCSNLPTYPQIPRTELEPAYSHRPMHQPEVLLQRLTAEPRVATSVNPWLSAVPRSADVATWRAKRSIKEIEDSLYAGDESGSESLKAEKARADKEVIEDKKAAMLLMHLSVRDGEVGEIKKGEGLMIGEGPRVKRRRATSM